MNDQKESQATDFFFLKLQTTTTAVHTRANGDKLRNLCKILR